MPERPPPHEAAPSHFETRRDALLLRIAGLREMVKETDLDPDIVSKELTELDYRVQQVKGSKDMALFEQMFDRLEKIADRRKK